MKAPKELDCDQEATDQAQVATLKAQKRIFS